MELNGVIISADILHHKCGSRVNHAIKLVLPVTYVFLVAYSIPPFPLFFIQHLQQIHILDFLPVCLHPSPVLPTLDPLGHAAQKYDSMSPKAEGHTQETTSK